MAKRYNTVMLYRYPKSEGILMEPTKSSFSRVKVHYSYVFLITFHNSSSYDLFSC